MQTAGAASHVHPRFRLLRRTDFVCFDARLIVEVDGFQHAENGRDLARDAFFRGEGFRILRFWNEEVVKNLDGVCLAILAELRNAGE
ncbi:DUF559 domain-containing protein [Pararhizobium polonicum]|uniref:DUF559 domain-containing protein n=1 Tax=Pararhizobium polonicum TaxID=1612624 RepID=UPI003082C10A